MILLILVQENEKNNPNLINYLITVPSSGLIRKVKALSNKDALDTYINERFAYPGLSFEIVSHTQNKEYLIDIYDIKFTRKDKTEAGIIRFTVKTKGF